MITKGSISQRQAEEFLNTVYPDQRSRNAAWVQMQMNENLVFGDWKEKSLQGLLQLQDSLFYMNRRAIQVCTLNAICANNSKTAHDLLNAAADYALHNSLGLAALFALDDLPADFGQIGTLYAGRLKRSSSIYKDLSHVSFWDGKTDLYPCYAAFQNVFDGSIRMSPLQLEQRLQYEKRAKSRILVHYADDQPDGFAICYMKEGCAVAKAVVYENIACLKELVDWMTMLWKEVDLCFSGSEPMDSLFEFTNIEKAGVIGLCTRPAFLAKAAGLKTETFEDTFAQLAAPGWNVMF